MAYRTCPDRHTDRKAHTQTGDYAQKPEVDFIVLRNHFLAQLMIIKRLYIPDFKSICHLVRSKDSFKINKGYIAKQSQKI